MKLIVDYDLCEANGMCVAAAPEVFALDDSDKLHVRTDLVDDKHRAQLVKAVAMCPRRALRLEGNG